MSHDVYNHSDLPAMEPRMHSYMNGRTVVTAVEKGLDFERFLATYNSNLRPQTQPELDLVIEMAVNQWRLRRVWSMEAAAIDAAMFEQNDYLHEHYTEPGDAARSVLAVDYLGDRSRILSFLHTMESRYRRHYTQAMRDLKEMRRLIAECEHLEAAPFQPLLDVPLYPELPFREVAKRRFPAPPPEPDVDPDWTNPHYKYRPTLVGMKRRS